MNALEWSAVLWRVTWQAIPWTVGAWVLVRLLPKLPASVRTTLWWLVGLKCLLMLAALDTVRLPLLPAPAATETPHVLRLDGPRTPPGVVAPVDTPGAPWKVAVVLLWLGGVAWGTGALGRELLHLRRLRREARPVEEGPLTETLRQLARELGVARTPRLLVSARVPGPLVLGAWRPDILLPLRGVEALSPLEQRMALAHELAHVRRRDLWFGWVPVLARTLLFFHPLVRRACQEYALAREEACDALALRATGAEPHDYGRLLLLFGVARAPAAAAASGAPSHLAALKRRIVMLQHARSEAKPAPRWARWVLGGLALVALVPFQVVAREAPAPESTPPSAPAAPAAPVVPTPALTPTPAATPKPPPPRSAAVPKPAAPSKPAEAPTQKNAQDDAYVFLQLSGSVIVSGSQEDVDTARALSSPNGQPLVYLRRQGQGYIIRDPETVSAISKSFEPQAEIGRKQAEVGRKQAEIGRKMAEVSRKQAAIGQQQGALGQKISALAQKQAELALQRMRVDGKEPKSQVNFEQMEKDIERQMEPFERQMEELGALMEKAGEPLEELGALMEKESAPMEALGAQMEKASELAEQKVQGLLDEAVSKGLAEPVKP